jgi:hypothetical protein
MLVATRDPMPAPGSHDGASRPPHVGKASHTTRLVAAMQIAGSVLAIPVGLGSAYSLYRANFSVDTTCQTLRANIVSMIDKKIDATARRMLVRHDVETFEKTCGGVDPDAEAAFKALLASEAAPPATVAHRVVAPVRAEAPAKAETKAEPKVEFKAEAAKDVRKAEPKLEPRAAAPKIVAKEPAHETVKEAEREPAKAAAPAAEHDPASDARWLDAVRGALVAHAPDKAVPETASADVAAIRGAPPHPLALPPPPVAAAPAAAAPVAAAPALPPPTQVSDPTAVAAAPPADPDRLVPPATIPDQSGPKPTGWLSHVPFVGQVLAK